MTAVTLNKEDDALLSTATLKGTHPMSLAPSEHFSESMVSICEAGTVPSIFGEETEW